MNKSQTIYIVNRVKTNLCNKVYCKINSFKAKFNLKIKTKPTKNTEVFPTT